MVPTKLLLDAFLAALAEVQGPGDPDHWEIDPQDFVGHITEPPVIVTITCKDANGVTVDTYAGPVDMFPGGFMNNPVSDGWADGVLTLELTGFDQGGSNLFVIDSTTGTPSGFVSCDWLNP